MGIQGLRKFIDGQSCSSTVASDAGAQFDHILFDTNSVVHRCYSKEQTPQQTIQLVIDRITALLTQTATPTQSVTFAFDGPAPVAKLRTQRLRRRKVQNLDVANNTFFSDLAITAGSRFMVQLENALAKEITRHFFGTGVKVLFFGSTVIGEGEFKISQALAGLASRPKADPNETVLVIGNDIDLTMTCFGATCFHNLFVLGPTSGQLFDIGHILMRWIQPGTGFIQDPYALASSRVDLTFLFLLNGGDHYTGLGEAGAEIWKKYKMAKTHYPRRCIVSPDFMSIDMRFLGQVLNVEQYNGDSDAKAGRELLRAALWSCCSTVTGVCLDYQFLGGKDLSMPTLAMIRAAIAEEMPVSLEKIRYRNPLTPIGTFVALMPRIDLMPESIKKVLLQNQQLCERLLNTMDPAEVVELVGKVLELAAPSFSTVDTALNGFTDPVRVELQPDSSRGAHGTGAQATSGRKRGGRRLELVQRQKRRVGGDVANDKPSSTELDAMVMTTTQVNPPAAFDYHNVLAPKVTVFRNPFNNDSSSVKAFRLVDGFFVSTDDAAMETAAEVEGSSKAKKRGKKPKEGGASASEVEDDDDEVAGIAEDEWIHDDGFADDDTASALFSRKLIGKLPALGTPAMVTEKLVTKKKRYA